MKLPRPVTKGQNYSLEETLAARRSVRRFTDEPLTKADISQLLWAAQGVTDVEGLRPASSAGASYPLELYVAMSAGFYKYDHVQHELTLRRDEDVKQVLYEAALAQDAIADDRRSSNDCCSSNDCWRSESLGDRSCSENCNSTCSWTTCSWTTCSCPWTAKRNASHGGRHHRRHHRRGRDGSTSHLVRTRPTPSRGIYSRRVQCPV